MHDDARHALTHEVCRQPLGRVSPRRRRFRRRVPQENHSSPPLAEARDLAADRRVDLAVSQAGHDESNGTAGRLGEPRGKRPLASTTDDKPHLLKFLDGLDNREARDAKAPDELRLARKRVLHVVSPLVQLLLQRGEDPLVLDVLHDDGRTSVKTVISDGLKKRIGKPAQMPDPGLTERNEFPSR